MRMSAPGGAALPHAVRFVPEDPYRVAIDPLAARYPGADGVLIGRNWLGTFPVSCVVRLGGGVELTCCPTCVVPLRETMRDNVIQLSNRRSSC